MGKLKDQGWDVHLHKGGMELQDRNHGLFADIMKMNKVYLVGLWLVASGAGLAGWMTDSGEGKSTYQELLGRLGKAAMTATVRGGSGLKASLLTWHCWLGHLSFKTIVELAQEGASGLEITDIPVRIPGLDACSACVAAKMVHLPHKEGPLWIVGPIERTGPQVSMVFTCWVNRWKPHLSQPLQKSAK